MAHYEPPHQDLRCLQVQLYVSMVVKELTKSLVEDLLDLRVLTKSTATIAFAEKL